MRQRIILGEPSSDGFHRSWIMMFAQGRYEHPQYGELDFSRERLARIKQNFDARARKIDIALDANHDQDKATGWVEELQLREAQADGTPAGLWGLIRWTPLGVQLLKDQVYRYFSPEFVDSWTDPQSGQTFDDVLLGGGLTNRPFLKELTPVKLSDGKVSRRPWGEVKKSQLPRSAFLDQGEPDQVDSWRLPVYEGAGPIVDGKYTKRGPLNINGVRAALAALGGAHTGSAMTGVPSGVRAKLERWMAQYGSQSKQADEEADVGKRRKELADGMAEGTADGENADDMEMAEGEDGEELADGDEGEQYDEADGDGADSEGAGDVDAESNTHGAVDGRHKHGKFGMHAHDGNADHSDAPLKGAAKGKKMGELGGESSREKLLTEKVALLERKLHEQTVDKQLAEWGGATFTLAEKGASGAAAKRSGRVGLSKAFQEKYRAFALAEGLAMGETRFAKVNELLSTLLSDGLVDLSVRAMRGYEMEERAAFAETGDPEAESRRLSERTRELAAEIHHKELRELPGAEVARLQRQAAKEIGYKRAQ